MKGKWGFIDQTGKLVISAIYREVRSFHGSYAPARIDKRWGYIDKKGTFVINPQYEDARPFSEGLAAVKKDNTWGYINEKGKVVIDYSYEDAKGFQNGLAPAKRQGKWGYIDPKGNFVLTRAWLDAGEFKEKIAPVKTVENQWGYIDAKGRFVIDAQFDDAGVFSDGMAPVREESKWGYIDQTGHFKINPQFDQGQPFSEKMAAVLYGGQWGYIDQKGKVVIPFSYNQAGDFSGGHALVSDGNVFYYIGKDGKDKKIASSNANVIYDIKVYNTSKYIVNCRLDYNQKTFGDFTYKPTFVENNQLTINLPPNDPNANADATPSATINFTKSPFVKTFGFDVIYTLLNPDQTPVIRTDGQPASWTQRVSDNGAATSLPDLGAGAEQLIIWRAQGAYHFTFTRVKYENTKTFDADATAQALIQDLKLNTDKPWVKFLVKLTAKALSKFMGDFVVSYYNYSVNLGDYSIPFGACVMPDNICMLCSSDDCAARQGSYSGDGSVCKMP